MKHDTEVVELHGTILKRTDRAILFETEDGKHWFPASVCLEVHSDPKTTGADRLVVELWFARKTGVA